MSAAPDQAARRGRPRSIATTTELEPREQILREAARLFSTKGVAGTRVTDIASAVGMSSPNIYYYFENLNAIVEALLTYVVDDSAAFATAAAKGTGPAPDRLVALVTRHVERLTSGPYDLWFVVGPSQASSAGHPYVSKKADQWRKSVARLVKEGTARGEFREIDPTLAVAAVMGLVYASLQLRHQGGIVDPHEIALLSLATLSPKD
jgi:AcrR family transcriptional regulator